MHKTTNLGIEYDLSDSFIDDFLTDMYITASIDFDTAEKHISFIQELLLKHPEEYKKAEILAEQIRLLEVLKSLFGKHIIQHDF